MHTQGISERNPPMMSSRHGRALAASSRANSTVTERRRLPAAVKPVPLAESLFLHPLSQAKRTHICPYLINVTQAFLLRAALAFISPPKRIFSVSRPDRILLFMIHNHPKCCALPFFIGH